MTTRVCGRCACSPNPSRIRQAPWSPCAAPIRMSPLTTTPRWPSPRHATGWPTPRSGPRRNTSWHCACSRPSRHGQHSRLTWPALRSPPGTGLLHDMGMLHIDPALLDSEVGLTGDRLNPVYVHPLTSSMLIGRFAEYPKEIVRAVVEHHERLDGSGSRSGE